MTRAILAFFILFSLMPSGVMPVRSAAGLKVVICTGHGPLTLALDPKTGKPVDQTPQKDESPCPFALAMVAFSLPPVPSLPPIIAAPLGAMKSVEVTAFSVGQATGLPPATGPPLSL